MSIGCTYLSYQVSQYFKSKKCGYDRSDVMKMTGVDCFRTEEQIEKFVYFFVWPGQCMSDVSCLELETVSRTVYVSEGDYERDASSGDNCR